MRKITLLAFLFILLSTLSFCQRSQKVGLVLSGGGARGLAHVGAIKALEDNNIPIDYISGTSVGAIVGALYASGYTVEQMMHLFLSEDFQRWLSGKVDNTASLFYKAEDNSPSLISFSFDTKNKFRFQLPTSIINPIQMDYAFMEIFAGASAVSNNNFDSLLVPFLCITSDITDNKASIRRNGNLGQAVRASMTFPLVFAPITLDGKIMFDGGMYNNFPAQEMHDIYNPDIIIGVKISANYPPPIEGDVVSYLQNIFSKETDYDVICANGVLIEPDLSSFGILEFDKMQETYKIGYKSALEKISKIRDFLVDSINQEDIALKRKNFNDRKPPLKIKNAIIEGVPPIQKSYFENALMFNLDDSIFAERLKQNYFALCFDNNIKTINPYIYYNNFSNSYVLNVNLKTQENLKAEIGGCLSSNPISHLFLGAEYNILKRSSWLFKSNVYLGRYYTSFMAGIKVNHPTRLPFYTKIEFNANKWSYYNLKTNFFDFSPLNYIIQRENNIQFFTGIPLGVKDKLELNIGYGLVKDDYFNIKYTTVYDTADRTTFSHLATGLTRTFSTLNSLQNPTSGIYSKMQVQYINGMESFSPGNTSSISNSKEKKHSWFQFAFRHKVFFDISKRYTLGWNADIFYSFQNLFSNYNSSLLNAGIYSPTLETFTQFMHEYRANQYLATGIENIFKFNFYRIDASIRLNANIYAPISQIITIENNLPTYSKGFFGKVYFIFTSALVVETPLGPLSVTGGYHQRDDVKYNNPFTISVNYGYIMFNKKNIDR